MAIAALLANILEAAEECLADPAPNLTFDHAAVNASRSDLTYLVGVLRSDIMLEVRGIALARLLAVERTSPLTGARGDRTLALAISEIFAAL